MKKFLLAVFTFSIYSSASYGGCWNDSECSANQVCECPSNSRTGNCTSIGNCVVRGTESAREILDLNAIAKLQKSVEALRADLLQRNSIEANCSISCSGKDSNGNPWTSSCGTSGCPNGCMPASCGESHCSAGCKN